MKRIILVFVIIAGLFLFANKPIHQKSIEKEWGREIMKLVGDLGTSLPRNDETITTKEGDIILYLGNKLCLYYNQNTWDFTKLGHIKDTTHLKEAIGKGSVTVTLYME